MIRKHLCAALGAAALLIASAATAQEAPTTPEGWRALTLTDLEAERELLRTQTPIPFDRVNPAYPAWLEEGYTRARALAENVRDESGHFYTLAFYANGFHDPHINVSAIGQLPASRWPGFIAASRHGGAVVVMRDETDAESPPLGAQIVSCEGRTLAALAEERVFPFTMNSHLAADRRRGVTRLFLLRDLPGIAPMRSCRISVEGAERDIALRWRPLPDDPDTNYWPAYSFASTGPAAEWGVTEPTPGVFWIGIPTFSSGEQTAPQLAALVAAIEAQAEAMRNGRAIVIDIRGNGGGNSQWADRIADAIFGAPVTTQARRVSDVRSAIDWRASPENIAYWQTWINEVAIPEFGQNSEAENFAQSAIRGMQSRLSANPPIWRQGPRRVAEGGGLTTRRPHGTSPFPARVYVLSNGSCGSSCLNFADVILFVPGVQLIGSATSGDGPYMEVRDMPLPSGRARLTFPQKVWRGMARGALEAYAPDVAYDGAWDDASVRAWTMALVQSEAAQ